MYDMYQEIILQHYKSPKNFGRLDSPTLSGEESNPNCGDRITIDLRLDPVRKHISEIRFSGDGCAISMASASMLTEKLRGKDLGEARAMTREDVLKMVGIPLSPVRVKCALTGFAAFGRALAGLDAPPEPAPGWKAEGSTTA